MTKNKILPIVLLLPIMVAVWLLYPLIQDLVTIFLFSVNDTIPPEFSDWQIDAVACMFQILIFGAGYFLLKRFYFDKKEELACRFLICPIVRPVKENHFLPLKLIVISLGLSGLSAAWLNFADAFLSSIPAFQDSFASFEQSFGGLDQENYLFVLGSVVIFGPIVEELMFRGIVYNSIKKAFNVWTAILLSALLFGIWHMELVQTIYVVIIGVGIAIVYEATGNMVYPALLHILNNFYSALPPQMDTPFWNSTIEIASYLMILPTVYLLFQFNQTIRNSLITNRKGGR